MVVQALLEAGAESSKIAAGLSALEMASAAGHLGAVATLISAGAHRGVGCALAIELAAETGQTEVVELLLTMALHEGDDLSPVAPMTARSDGAGAIVSVVDAADLEADPTLWTQAFATSTPLLVRGCGKEWSDAVSTQSPARLRERWGEHNVTVAFSPDELYHHPVQSSAGMVDGRGEERRIHDYVLRETPLEAMSFAEYVDLLPSHGQREFFAVSQSATASLEEFDMLSTSEPTASGLPSPLGRLIGPNCNRKNMWICSPPKISETHFDGDDSVLLQLSGTKRFTLVDPGPLGGLSAYPSLLTSQKLSRSSPGCFEEVGSEGLDRSLTLIPNSDPNPYPYP